MHIHHGLDEKKQPPVGFEPTIFCSHLSFSFLFSGEGEEREREPKSEGRRKQVQRVVSTRVTRRDIPPVDPIPWNRTKARRAGERMLVQRKYYYSRYKPPAMIPYVARK